MKNTKLKQMEELDAKIEKINYDLSGLESRKKEMEDSKFDKQQNIEKLEEETRTILAKTDKMNRLEKIIYIAFASKNDLKQVDLLNAKITELRNEKDSIQDKSDIQNKFMTHNHKFHVTFQYLNLINYLLSNHLRYLLHKNQLYSLFFHLFLSFYQVYM